MFFSILLVNYFKKRSHCTQVSTTKLFQDYSRNIKMSCVVIDIDYEQKFHWSLNLAGFSYETCEKVKLPIHSSKLKYVN